MSGPPRGPPFPGFPFTGPPFPFPTGPPSGTAPSSSATTKQSSISSSTESSIISSTTPSTIASAPSTQTSLPAVIPQSQQSHKSSIIGPIVGAVVGALILLSLLLAWRGIVWIRRRKRKNVEEKGPESPTRETDLEAAVSRPVLHESVTPYSYHPSGELMSATTLTGSVGPPWPKKVDTYGVDSMLVAHNAVDSDTQSLARSASMWTTDTKHTSTSMSTAAMSPSSPGGVSVSTSAHTPAIRIDPNTRISQNNLPLEVVIERPVVGDDIPPPYQRNVT